MQLREFVCFCHLLDNSICKSRKIIESIDKSIYKQTITQINELIN